MAESGLRGFLERLRQAGELLTIKREVDPRYELSAVIKRAGGRTVLCERIKGWPGPVVANVLGDYRQLELLFDTPRAGLLQEYLRRTSRPIPPQRVETGPVKEQVYTGDQVDLSRLPLPTINEKDAGPYIDAGIIVVKDPEYGPNLSIQRLQLQGPRQSGIFYNQVVQLKTYHERAEERGEGLEVAVVIGCDPVLYIASQMTRGMEVNEYDYAGALKGEPIRLVHCETVDLEVPAEAEMVLEGVIPAGVREPEGPFGEFTGYYHGALHHAPLAPVVHYKAMTCRRQPIFQTIYLGKPPTEGTFISALPKRADLFNLIREVVPEVRDVYFTPGGCGRFHAIAAIRKRSGGDGKLALGAMLSSRIGVKYAVVVDDDIDPHNLQEVEWAIATRSQFDRDSLVISHTSSQIDPSRDRTTHLITKVGIDATRPWGVEFPEVCDVPAEVRKRVEREWDRYVEG